MEEEISAEGAPRNHGPGDLPSPADEDAIERLRIEIDTIDSELVRLILRRAEVSQLIGQTKKSRGGTKIVYNREMAVLERFRALGPAGAEFGMMLLAMGRGKLGRK